MTLQSAINEADSLRPNDFTQAQKLRWLNDLDGLIFREVFMTHFGAEQTEFSGHGALTDTLLVSFPDDGLYPLYLVMAYDLHNGETGKYNNSANAFEAAYQTFANAYNRSHFPCADGRLKF